MTKFPYNDEYMEYDYRSHRYILTSKAVSDILGENLDTIMANNDPITRNAFLRETSDSVYEYILSASQSPDYIEYILAKDGSMRQTVQEMLVSQVKYSLINSSIENYSGVNMSKGQYIDNLDVLRGDRAVSSTVVRKSNAILPIYGHSLRYAGVLPHVSRKYLHVGY